MGREKGRKGKERRGGRRREKRRQKEEGQERKRKVQCTTQIKIIEALRVAFQHFVLIVKGQPKILEVRYFVMI